MSENYLKFVDSVSSIVYYHIHVTIEAQSRDSTQFLHNISEYSTNILKDISIQYKSIYKAYVEIYDGTMRKSEILDLFIQKTVPKLLDKTSKEKMSIFGRMISETVINYSRFLIKSDDEYFFTTAKNNKSLLVGSLKDILKNESINIGYELSNSSKQTVPRVQYEILLKKYKSLLAENEQLKKNDSIANFIED
jgi:hypothetical protein